MQFCFYPRHEFACPEVGHCPHLGGAALATVVSVANQSGRDRDLLHLQLAAERASVARLLAENAALQQQLQQVKLELRLERQSKFMTNRDQRQAHDAAAVVAETTESQAASDTPRQRGAPVGHPGWFRKTPTEFDQTIDVAAPDQCPHCGGAVRGCSSAQPGEHVQEDVVDCVYQVVVYRHPAARCRACRRWVRQPGAGELLGSRIGPRLRALALFLRNDIAQKIASTEGPVHADETYWSLNGERAYFWVHGTEQFLHFQFDTSRAGEVSRAVLGEDFAGMVVLRKLTFGHRTSAGAQRMAQILTVQETAKRHGRRASEIFYRLLTEPPHRVLKFLYAGGAC